MVILVRWALAAAIMALRYPKVALGVVALAVLWAISPIGTVIGLAILLVMYQSMSKPRPSRTSLHAPSAREPRA